MAHPIENSYHSLQLVQKEVDGNQVLAGHEELHNRAFDMVTREVDGMLLFNFDPTNDATRETGVFALLDLLDALPPGKRVVFVSPGSDKSEKMVQEVVEAYRKQTGIDHKLFIFAKSSDDPSSSDGGFDGHVQDYVPVTAPDETRYLALSPQQETEIAQMVEDGAMVVALDDIFSTGATLEAIDKLLGKIGVKVNKRFAVGAEIPAEVVEIRNDVVLWKPKAGHSNQGLEVQTAFTLPLFQGMDVATIIEGDTPWHQKI